MKQTALVAKVNLGVCEIEVALYARNQPELLSPWIFRSAAPLGYYPRLNDVMTE
jgi:hypothetical protein